MNAPTTARARAVRVCAFAPFQAGLKRLPLKRGKLEPGAHRTRMPRVYDTRDMLPHGGPGRSCCRRWTVGMGARALLLLRARSRLPIACVCVCVLEKSLRRCAMRNLHDARHVDMIARRRPVCGSGARARAHRTVVCVSHTLSSAACARANAHMQHPRWTTTTAKSAAIIAVGSWTVRAPCAARALTRPASRSRTMDPHARVRAARMPTQQLLRSHPRPTHTHARRSSTDKATLPTVGGA